MAGDFDIALSYKTAFSDETIYLCLKGFIVTFLPKGAYRRIVTKSNIVTLANLLMHNACTN